MIDSGPVAHQSTINPDGSPQVTVTWISLDGNDLVGGQMAWYMKLLEIERGKERVTPGRCSRPGVTHRAPGDFSRGL